MTYLSAIRDDTEVRLRGEGSVLLANGKRLRMSKAGRHSLLAVSHHG